MYIISGYVIFRGGVVPRQHIYFRANSINIRHVFCFCDYSRTQPPDILNRAHSQGGRGTKIHV